jgi:hypothetical protein
MFSDIYGWSKDLKFYNIDKCFVYILVGFYLSKKIYILVVFPGNQTEISVFLVCI